MKIHACGGGSKRYTKETSEDCRAESFCLDIACHCRQCLCTRFREDMQGFNSTSEIHNSIFIQIKHTAMGVCKQNQLYGFLVASCNVP